MTFNQLIKIVLLNEGGYVNDPQDPGGETKYGISKKSFPNVDIKNLTIEDAVDIYFHKYWLPMKIDGINSDLLKLHVFDMGVNAGPANAIKLLQAIVDVYADGIIGNNTLKAVNEYKDQSELTNLYSKARLIYYENKANIKPQLAKYIKGWTNRITNTTNEFNRL